MAKKIASISMVVTGQPICNSADQFTAVLAPFQGRLNHVDVKKVIEKDLTSIQMLTQSQGALLCTQVRDGSP